MLGNLKININTLYEILDSTDLLGRGVDILDILETIADNNGKFSYKGKEWDLTK